jgi:hypothetical protein
MSDLRLSAFELARHEPLKHPGRTLAHGPASERR